MLFRESDDYTNNADVLSGAQYYNMWDKYAMSYKLAAETIADRITHDNSNIDYLVYPLIFLYRHYFELRIKEILFTSQDYSDIKIDMPFHHDLLKAWEKCLEKIKEIRPEVRSSQLQNVEMVLRDFNKYDNTSMSFRYPIDKKNNPTLNSLNYINVKIFLESINLSISFLEDITKLISATIDFKDIE